MQIVNFNANEKLQIVSYLEEKKSNTERKLLSLDREINILTKYKNGFPIDAKAYIKAIDLKIEEFNAKKYNIKLTTKRIEGFIKKFKKPEIELFNTEKELLKELYTRESIGGKAIEKKYYYFPRLKQMKEKVIYEFANKIKTVMEIQDVKIA